MIPRESENEKANEKSGRATPAREAGEAVSSASYFHWEISTSGAFPTARDVEQRFEDRLRRWRAPGNQPSADVFVDDHEIWVQMDLPGVDENDVAARIEGDGLIVEAVRRLEPPSASARPTRLERPRGPFHRRVPLPFAPGPARLEYELSSGVLLVRVVPGRER
jgi:HSP20 family molecular chaperone IbpA